MSPAYNLPHLDFNDGVTSATPEELKARLRLVAGRLSRLIRARPLNWREPPGGHG